ncbi:Putative bicarbonate transporter [Septoria linicola]|uniref:Bicarbonate transporter n=1 Tax=Septoria linicola TaxID=215465 RepID=A0A9Q9AW25_9PEZI|nr:putative bicarbonate transporter [Septoria linicola]USW53158.1 Putative bicarbonate transporter [Septoria linicola]
MKLNLGVGIRNDIRRRLPFYVSDWKDAWNYRTIPTCTLRSDLLPALAFSFDMFARTNDSFGVNEVLLAQVIGCCMYSIPAAQPLVIVGVTGPIAIFAYTIYDIAMPQGYDYFAFWA